MLQRLLLSFAFAVLMSLPFTLDVAADSAAQDNADLDALPPCDFATDNNVNGLRVGAVVYNFQTGAGCTQNLDSVFPIASVPKVFVSGAYHRQVAQGRLSAQQTMQFTEDYLMGGSYDCLNQSDLGRDVPLQELDDIMISCSDNAATWMLMDAMGWDYVDSYVNSLGLEDVGPVIPYSEVDRLKLAFIDEQWNSVPRALASRYMRGRETDELDQYFDDTPRYSWDQLREANQQYFDSYNYNTATPRALAEFFFQLRHDYLNDFGAGGQTASHLFNAMLGTQRQYSTQAFPGTVYVGAKNGFDTGLVAEVNFAVSSLEGYQRTPTALAIIFTQQTDVTTRRVQSPRDSEGVLNQLLRALSPQIVDVLYPDYTPPPVTDSWMVNTVRLNTSEVINDCWFTYRDSGRDAEYLGTFQTCLGASSQKTTYEVGDNLALGLVLSGLEYEDTRLTFIYTRPDGAKRSYQTRVALKDSVGINWYHPVDMPGTWGVDIYLNLEHVYSTEVTVGSEDTA